MVEAGVPGLPEEAPAVVDASVPVDGTGVLSLASFEPMVINGMAWYSGQLMMDRTAAASNSKKLLAKAPSSTVGTATPLNP
eukprot:14884600-Alexandrium_andersonii.AAC.1